MFYIDIDIAFNLKILFMKKILILLLMLPLITSAQIKLYPKFAATYGTDNLRVLAVNSDNLQVFPVNSDTRYDYKYANFMFRTGLDAKYKKFTVYYDTKIWCNAYGLKFDPHQASFELGVTYQVNDKIKINAHHTCLHPLSTDNGHTHDQLYGGGDVITVSYGY